MKLFNVSKIISDIHDNAEINMQVTDSTVDNIRPLLADFLSHPDLSSMHMKSTVLFESSSLLEGQENEKASRIFSVMDHATAEFLSKIDISIPFDRSLVRSFDLPACHGHHVLFEITLSRIMQYFSSYQTSKKRHVQTKKRKFMERSLSSLTHTIYYYSMCLP